MAEPYLIKKYSSRRLYDVAQGGFLTTGDVDRLIRQGERIKVIDAKGNDVTRGVLLQILTEREEGGEPLLSVDVLHDMVRLYGNAMHGPFGQFMEEGLAVMRQQQAAWQDALPNVLREGTRGVLGKLLDQQMEWWKVGQRAWFGGDVDDVKPSPKSPTKPRARRG